MTELATVVVLSLVLAVEPPAVCEAVRSKPVMPTVPGGALAGVKLSASSSAVSVAGLRAAA